ncbi:MAG: gamma-glutamyltransferase [Bacteroidota bacterium]
MNRTTFAIPSLKILGLSILLSFSFYACRIQNPQEIGVLADHAMVVSAHPVATKVGLDILKEGGNAFDAAIATQFALAVVYPAAGNIGGGGFMVARNNRGRTFALDFREMAPAAANRDMYIDSTGAVIEDLSWFGHLAAGVPGAVAGMQAIHDSLGSLPWEALVQPSIDIAAQGVSLTEKEAKQLNEKWEYIQEYNTRPNAYTQKETWIAGDVILHPELAQTLKMIRDQKSAGFYEGWVADSIVAEMQRGGGLITQEDLKNYRAIWRKPISGNYRDLRVISMPPPSSGGIALLQLLASVEPYPLAQWGWHDTRTIHLMVEAERRAYADRATHLGDPDYYPVPIENLIDTAYIRQRMADFDPFAASTSVDIAAGQFTESEATTHFSIIDSMGNAVSLTTTLNGSYGSCVVVGGGGFFLNNEMDDFSAKPGVPNKFGLLGAEANAIQPGKRMLSSMTPTIVTRNNDLYMVVGTPGGSTIITSVFQNILNVHEFGFSMQTSVAAPRFHHQWRPDAIFKEATTFSLRDEAKLEALGHKIYKRGNIGRVDAIWRRPDGKLEAGADPRGDDSAMGY